MPTVRRRELVAGLGSVGVLSGAAGALLGGVPSFGDDTTAPASDESSDGPITVETIDARGSEAGELTVPTGDVTVVMFFVTGCGQCQAHMPHLAEARSRLVDDHGDAVTFLSVTYQSFGAMPPDELRSWWRDHGGNWAVGYDQHSDLAAEYGVVGYPVTIVLDEQGKKRWEELGIQSVDAIVGAVESVLEADSASAGSETNDTETTG